MNGEVTLQRILEARQAVAGFAKETPLLSVPSISRQAGRPVLLKAECLQRTGAFKVRGAYNKIRQLPSDEREKGVIAASAGNHAQGVALAAQGLGIPAVVVMPSGAPITKVQATRGYGAQVILAGQGYDEAYQKALEVHRESGAAFLHAFDDPAVIAGQGTIGLEILDQAPLDLETVIVPIGGGGLISGIATAIKSLRPKVRVIGVQASGAPSMYRAFTGEDRGTEAPVRTIADGIAVKRPGTLTSEIIKTLVDDIVLVDEEEIAASILLLLELAKLMVEGAGAVSLAAALGGRVPGTGPAAVVVSGGNIDVNILSRIIERGLVRAGRYVRLGTMVPDRPGELQKLLSLVARTGANVISVHHERWLSRIAVGEVEVDLALETRDTDHARELVEVLNHEGYRVVPALVQGWTEGVGQKYSWAGPVD